MLNELIAVKINNGASKFQEGDLGGAIDELNIVLKIDPQNAHASFLMGLAKSSSRDYLGSLQHFDVACNNLSIRPAALVNKGIVYRNIRRFNDSVSVFKEALRLDSKFVEAYCNLGNVYIDLCNYESAIEAYNSALSIDNNHFESLNNLGSLYDRLKNYPMAYGCYQRALQSNTNAKFLIGHLLFLKLKMCDWNGYEEIVADVKRLISAGEYVITPFQFASLPSTPSLQQKCAQIYTKFEINLKPGIVNHQEEIKQRTGRKIKVCYVSADFHNHATAYLIAEMIQLHDRSQFEILCISYGELINDEMQLRLRASSDVFIDAAESTDAEIAQLVKDFQIDILVDLKGHTQDTRLGIFALRPAPIQIHYLGFPGTIGSDFMDYLVADPILIPKSDIEYYNEKILFMPQSYQVNDRKRLISDRQTSRSEFGLSDSQFVYCCFNNSWKITPDVFMCWVQILKSIPNSVLWLIDDNDAAKANLRARAVDCGLSEERLVFATKVRLDLHLARHKHADLFLDTFNYNAHTTASDALWSGLPVLSKIGNTYPSRVGASLLKSVGLDDLVVNSNEDYVRMAISLAQDKESINKYKLHLQTQRHSLPLFDTPKFTRDIETAYHLMVEAVSNKIKPADIYI